MNTVFETNFTVMPPDTNYESPLIFGGAFFGHIDLCAAQTANRFLYDSKTAVGAVTHKVLSVSFDKPTYLGELIYLTGKVVDTGKKSIVVEVIAERESRNRKRTRIASAKLVFVSIGSFDTIKDKPEFLPYVEHGLSLESV